MPFSIQHLNAILASIGQVNGLWVAYSGGVDSHCLLNFIIKNKFQLIDIKGVIHIHHGLHPAADQWSDHCRTICKNYGADYRMIKVEPESAGKGVEQAARDARYRAFESILGSNEALLLAHHRDDQAETFLLQALRGAGPQGLASMPAWRPLGRGYLVRPMLDITREQILNYAADEGLEWIEDDSNYNEHHERNYLRNTVMPIIRQRWPAASRTLARAADQSASLVEMTANEISALASALHGSQPDTLSVSRLMSLNARQASHIIRSWLRSRQMALPGSDLMDELLAQIRVGPDRQIRLRWANQEARRFQDDLYVIPCLSEPAPGGWQHQWRLPESCEIPELGGTLAVSRADGDGVAVKHCHQSLTIRPRSGGEKIRPRGQAHHKELKKLYQEAGIPPWVRERLPLIYRGKQLVAVADLWTSDELAPAKNEPGYIFHWQSV